MKLQPHQPPYGIALIIVMVVIISLGILAGGFAYSMKVETTLARNASTDSDLEWMGRSGIELAKYVLSQPGQGGMQFDALNQKWAGGTGDTNSPAAEIPLDNYPLGRGTISVKIVDLDRKFNINTAPRSPEILRQAMILVGIDAAEGSKILNAILDWIDADDSPQMGSSDTESSYYLKLKPPYRAKNGPIDDLTEMMLINGITPAMFYGSGQVGQNTRGALHRQGLGPSALDEPTYPVGFAELFTTLSSGQININTASATVLQLIPEVDENLAQAIITARAGPDGAEGDEDDMPFRSLQELMRVPGMPPGLVNQFARYFNTRSTTFEVQVEAQIGGYKRHFTGLVRRDGNRLQDLFLYWN
jgi:type II secretory pathway component PulK